MMSSLVEPGCRLWVNVRMRTSASASMRAWQTRSRARNGQARSSLIGVSHLSCKSRWSEISRSPTAGLCAPRDNAVEQLGIRIETDLDMLGRGDAARLLMRTARRGEQQDCREQMAH